MICNRCGAQNDPSYKFCLRCGNQLIQGYNPMYNNNQVKKSKNNTGRVLAIVGIIFVLFIIMIFMVLPRLLFDSATSKLNTRYKAKLYLNEKYSDEEYKIVSKNKRSKTNKSCGTYTEYVWTVENKSTGETFEVISSKSYGGAFVCTTYNYDTRNRK